MTYDAGGDHAARISAYRSELAELRVDRSRAQEPMESRGNAADGQVSVVAGAGRLHVVEVAGLLMRLSGDDLAPLVMEAANAALAGARPDPVSGEPPPDLPGLTDSLAATLAESELAMHRLQGALSEAIAKAGPRSGLGGDVPAQEASRLLYDAMDALRSVRGVTPEHDHPDEVEVRGIGSDDAGHVSAEVDGAGRLVRLVLGPSTGRFTSVHLGELIVEAVNRALDDVESAPASAGHQGPAAEDLGRRVAELQDASVRQMAALTGALTGIIARIRQP